MAVICPKCKAIRAPDAKVPDWQCPSCGIAYAKAGTAASPPPALARAAATPAPVSSGMSPLAKAFIVFLLLCVASGLYKGMQKSGSAFSSSAIRMGQDLSDEQLGALARTVKDGDVVIYSAVWCTSCNAAKQWMKQYGFAFQDCDVERDSDCGQRFAATGSKWVPYLVVKGHHMKDGFDSDEFIAALKP